MFGFFTESPQYTHRNLKIFPVSLNLSKYGEDIIEENIVYKLNNEMVNKYADIISELIINCNDIKEEDKFNIITSSTEYSIKKGTIDELYTLNEKYQIPVNEIYSDIKPVESLQKPKKIK